MEAFEPLPYRLSQMAQKRPDAVAFREVSEGRWTSKTWAEVANEVSRLAAGLVSQEVQPQDRVLGRRDP